MDHKVGWLDEPFHAEAVGLGTAQSTSKGTNQSFGFLDTVYAKRMSIYGGPARTNLEAFSKGGVVFEQAISHFQRRLSHWLMMLRFCRKF